MIVLKALEALNYKNLEKIHLNNFNHLNIFIGPNNCGKSSILKSIELVGKITFDPLTEPNCAICRQAKNGITSERKNQYGSYRLNGVENDRQYKEKDFQIVYTFDKPIVNLSLNDINQLFGGFSGNQTALSECVNHFRELNWQEAKIKSLGTYAIAEHLLPTGFNHTALLVDDTRLHQYHGQPIKEYVLSKDLTSVQLGKFSEYLKRIIDPRIKDWRSTTANILFDSGFADQIENQGSGIRSLICIFADILSLSPGSMVMIDEPELGLTPHVKQEFMKIISVLDEYQLFIATHDPAFLNPIILPRERMTIFVLGKVVF